MTEWEIYWEFDLNTVKENKMLYRMKSELAK